MPETDPWEPEPHLSRLASDASNPTRNPVKPPEAHELGRDTELGLIVPAVHEPWFWSLLRQCRREQPMPPLALSSKPVAVKQIWGAYDQRGRGMLASTVLHIVVVLLLFTILSSPHIERAALQSIDLYVPIDAVTFLAALTQTKTGGGGGGLNSPLPESHGKLPRFDERQLAPATVKPVENARLPVEPTLLGPSDLQVATLDLQWFGDPLADIGPPSQGPGSGGGIGNSNGTGIGPGNGPGYGPGRGGGASALLRIGGDVRAPLLVRRVEPEYTEQARKARLQGTVVVLIEVWPDGKPHNIRVQTGLGLGLNEAAVKAVEQWRFKPATKDGVPVRVGARVEVYFRLL